MDTRLTELLPAALGLKNGDAKIIKTHPLVPKDIVVRGFIKSESPFFTYFRREKTFFSYFFGIFKKSFYLCLRNDNKTRMH